MRPKLITGPRVLVWVNSKLYGVVKSFSYESDTPRKGIQTIDMSNDVELGTTRVKVRWNMTVYRVGGDGGLQGAGLVARSHEISKEKYFSILVVDRLYDLPIFSAEMCQTDRESGGINAKGIMEIQLSGTGILWSNETNQYV